MCDQRERLIGYLYDECDTAERAAVKAHVDECAVCRDEIAGFRSVQDDLRAWDVPDHESVWRPFAPAAAPAWWQQVPRWAMAAAAGLVLISGATGGAVAYLLAPKTQPATMVVQQTAPPPILQPASTVTADDIAAAEQRVMERVRLQFAAFENQFSPSSDRVLTASNIAIPGEESRLRQLEQQIGSLRAENEKQLGIILSFNDQLRNQRLEAGTQYGRLKFRVDSLVDLVTNK